MVIVRSGVIGRHLMVEPKATSEHQLKDENNRHEENSNAQAGILAVFPNLIRRQSDEDQQPVDQLFHG